MPRRAPQMIDNIPRLGDARLGFVFTAGTVMAVVIRVGLPLLVGAGIVAGAGALAKTALPDVGISTERIPHAALLGGVGVAAYYAGNMLPDGWQPVAYIAAVAGVSASVYWLFSGETGPANTKSTATNPIPPFANRNDFEIKVNPEQPFNGGTNRSIYVDQDYRATISNNTGEKHDFFVGLRVVDEDGSHLYKTGALDPDDPKGPYGRKHVTIPAGGEIDVTMPHPALWNSGGALVEFELFRDRYKQDPAIVSASIPVMYSWSIDPILW